MPYRLHQADDVPQVQQLNSRLAFPFLTHILYSTCLCDQRGFNILSNVIVMLISAKQIFFPSDVSYLTGLSPVVEWKLSFLCCASL